MTGSFYIYDRYRYKTMRSDVGRGQRGFYEVEKVPYTQFFHKDFAFHGAFWHNNFGHPASHGCVNLAIADALWLYRWTAPAATQISDVTKGYGTRVRVE